MTTTHLPISPYPQDRSLVPAALLRLILIRYKGVIRRLFRGSAKRKVFAAVGMGIMALYILPAAFNRQRPNVNPDTLRLWLPLALVGFVIIQLFARAKRDPMTFQPAELDLVVPGPFSRRQLVLYQLAYQVGPLLLMGFWLAIFVRFGGLYVGRALGAALVGQLTMLLASIFTALIGILRNRSRFGLLVPVAVVAALGSYIYFTAPRFPDPITGDLLYEWAVAVRHLPAVEALALPFVPYANLFTAQTWAEIPVPTLLGACLNALLIAVYVVLDRGEVEAIVLKSQKRLEAVQKLRAGGRYIANPAAAARRVIPRPPFFGGAGPLAWRQCLATYRTGGPVSLVLIPILLIGASAWIGHTAVAFNSIAALPFIALGLSIFLSMIVRCDFRADLDHIPTLKTLPIHPRTVVIGQLAAPLIVVGLLELFIGVGLSLGSLDAGIALRTVGIYLACIPLTGALVAIENTVFLIAPLRSFKAASTAGFDPSLVGRHFLVTTIKLVLFLTMAALAGGPAWLLIWLHFPIPVAFAAAFLVSLCILYALILACSAAFRSFNVVDDQPP